MNTRHKPMSITSTLLFVCAALLVLLRFLRGVGTAERRSHAGAGHWLRVLCMLGVLGGMAGGVQAATINEPLTGASFVNSWTLRNSPCLTASGGGCGLSESPGRLRLTEDGVGGSMNMATFNADFDLLRGIDVTLMRYEYSGGSPAADGMLVMLVDPSVANFGTGGGGGGGGPYINGFIGGLLAMDFRTYNTNNTALLGGTGTNGHAPNLVAGGLGDPRTSSSGAQSRITLQLYLNACSGAKPLYVRLEMANVQKLAGCYGPADFGLTTFPSVVRLAISGSTGGFTQRTAVSDIVIVTADAVAGSYPYWDGPGNATNGVLEGGSGIWNLGSAFAGNGNWANAGGVTNTRWNSADTPVFGGTAGTVTVDNTLGAININGLTFNTSGYTLSGGALTGVAASNTLTAGSGINATVGSVLAGGNAFNKAGVGTIILTGANSYTGATTVSAGTLQVGAGSISGSIASSSGVSVAAGATLAFNRSDADSLGGAISGAGAVTKSGAGNTNLTGANSYTGSTTITGGTLRVNGNQSSATGAVTVSTGATLGGSGTLGGAVTVNSGGTLAPGNSPGAITMGTTSLAAGSNLNMELGQANTVGGSYNDLVQVNGDLTLAGGTLNVAVPTSPSGGAFTPGTYRLINYTGTLTNSGGLVIGSLPAGFTAAQVVIDTSTAGQVNLIVLSANSNYWDVSPQNNSVVDGGTGNWIASGSGSPLNWTDALGVSNTQWFNGSTAIFAGTAGTVTVSGTQSIGGLTFNTTGYTVSGGILTGAATSNILMADTGISATVGSVLAGSNAFNKAGAGTIILTAANTYSGSTSVSAGVLQLGINAALPATAMSVSAGATLNINGFSQSLPSITSAGTLALGSGGNLTLTTGVSSIGAITGSGSITVNTGASLTLSAALVNSGVNIVLAGGTLNLGVFTHSMGTLSLTAASTLDFASAGTAQLTVATLNPAFALNVTNWTQGTDHFYATVVTGAPTRDTNNITPLNNIALTGSNVAQTVWLSNTNEISTAPPPTVTKAFSPTSVAIASASTLTITLTNPNPNPLGGAAFTDTYPSNLINTSTPSGTTTCGSGSVTAAAGGSSVVLSGGSIPANSSCTVTVNVTSNAPATYVNTLAIGALTSNGGANAVAASATLNVNGSFTYWDGPSANTTTLEGGAGTWNATNNNWTLSSGTPNGPWGAGTSVATFAGTAGTVTVSGTQSIGGLTFNTTGYTVSGGILTGAATTNILMADTGISATVGSVLAGSNAFNKAGAGTIILTAANTYSGSTSVSAGVLQLGINAALPATAVSVSTGATLNINGFSQSLPSISSAGTLALGSSGSLTLTTGASSIGAITGSGSITVNTGASLTLSAALVNSGVNIVLAGGTLNLGVFTHSMGTLSLTAASTLDFASAGTAQLTVATLNPAFALNVTNWTQGTDHFFATAVSGASARNTVNLSPLNNITLSGYTAAQTAWLSSNELSGLMPPTIVLAFSPAGIGTGANSTLTITLSNPNATDMTAAGFTDTYPANLVNGTAPAGATSCTGGSVTAAAGGASVALSGGTISANSSCTVTVSVTSNAPGTYVNTLAIGALTSSGGPNAAAASATLTVTGGSISGHVFLDNGAGSGTANDGIFNGSEAPQSGIGVSLSNCSGTVYGNTVTDGNGNYSLNVPSSVASGAPLCVVQTNKTGRLSTGASVGSTALPDGTATLVAGTSYSYTRTTDRMAFNFSGTGHANLNFADVDSSTFGATGTKTGSPGNSVSYPHTFTAQTAGSITFSVATSVSSPALAGWSEKIVLDAGCTGTLQAGAAVLYPTAASTPVIAGQQVCVIVQEFIPGTAQNGYGNDAQIQVALSLSNTSPTLTAVYTLHDVTQVSSSALDLRKEVRNVTQNVTAWGINNQAKSGEVLEYQITYTNNGTSPITALSVSDATPNYTTFVSAVAGPMPAGITACQKNTPANAVPAATVVCSTSQTVIVGTDTGTVSYKFSGTLNPSATGTVRFQVKVD